MKKVKKKFMDFQKKIPLDTLKIEGTRYLIFKEKCHVRMLEICGFFQWSIPFTCLPTLPLLNFHRSKMNVWSFRSEDLPNKNWRNLKDFEEKYGMRFLISWIVFVEIEIEKCWNLDHFFPNLFNRLKILSDIFFKTCQKIHI